MLRRQQKTVIGGGEEELQWGEVTHMQEPCPTCQQLPSSENLDRLQSFSTITHSPPPRIGFAVSILQIGS